MRTVSLVMLLTLGVLPTAPVQAQQYPSYANARFGYAICYHTFMKSRPEAPNGDGRTFVAPDGGKLAVFGRNNIDKETLADTVREDSADLAGSAGRITYRAQRANWAVYSGTNGNTVFYSKTFAKRDSFAIFELTYPRSAAARYKEVATRLSGCFRLIG